MPLPQIDKKRLEAMSPEELARVQPILDEIERLVRDRPLEKFRDDNAKQVEALAAQTPVQAALAGNQFGKTTFLVVKALINLCPVELIPTWMRPFRHVPVDGYCFGRIVCPSFAEGVEGVILPTFKEWAPREALRGGSFEKAWNKGERKLEFVNGSWCQLMTYDQDPEKFVGARLDFVGYDEPPPREIRNECLMRLVSRRGFEMFAMTPLKVNTGWVRREIYRKREHPDITVIQGAIHDNKIHSAETVERILSSYSPEERRAREFGEFMDFGGLIYPGYSSAVIEPPAQAHPQQLDVIVGIDPGVRNAALIWVGFDSDDTALVFDEVLLQDADPETYAKAIRSVNEKWGIAEEPLYVIDPSARNRALTNRESVQGELARFGIFAIPGQNSVDAGIMQVRSRLRNGRLWISRECVGLRDEMDDYAAEETPDGSFKPIKAHDHRCFVAETQVQTEQGPKAIWRVRPGDKVWTRDGLRKVAGAVVSGYEEVWELDTSQGRLVGTGNHPVWTENRGWVRMDSVRHDDILKGWPKSSNTTGSSSDGTPIPSTVPTGCTSLRGSLISSAALGDSTRSCGRKLTARSRLGATFTTATATLSTTISAISNVSPGARTPRNTGRRSEPLQAQPAWTPFGPSPRLGTHPRKGSPGTESMAVSWLLPGIGLLTSANSAERPLKPFQRAATDSARTSASPRGGERPVWMTWIANAWSAARRSGSTSTPRSSAVRVLAEPRRRAGRSVVYNLQVEGTPEFYADGVLVHNCDALRYVCMQRPFFEVEEMEAPKRGLGRYEAWPSPAQSVPVASTGSFT